METLGYLVHMEILAFYSKVGQHLKPVQRDHCVSDLLHHLLPQYNGSSNRDSRSMWMGNRRPYTGLSIHDLVSYVPFRNQRAVSDD